MNVKGDIFARLFSAGCILGVFIGLVGVPPGSSLAMPTGIVIRVDAHATGAFEDGTSWPNAYRSLQTALSVAVAGDEIWVANGLYKPDTPTGRDATFSLIAGVGIYGGFGGQDVGETSREQRDWRQYITVLTGDLDNNDQVDANGVVTSTAGIFGQNAYHVVSSQNVTETAVLDGFTITSGKADESDLKGSGGGMFNIHGNPTLSNLTFSGNLAALLGGGLYNTPLNVMYDSAVYVSTSGTDSTTYKCNQLHPCRTFLYTQNIATVYSIPLMRIQSGTYAEVLIMISGVNVQGGYDAYWNLGDRTDSAHKVEITGGTYDGQAVGVAARNLASATSLTDVVVTPINASSSGNSSYAILVNSSSALTIQRVTVNAAYGANGTAGANGGDASQTRAQDGNYGQNAGQVGICDDTSRGYGGSPGYGLSGGYGGNGGTTDIECDGWPWEWNFNPSAGSKGYNAASNPGGYGLGGAGGGVCGNGSDGGDGVPLEYGAPVVHRVGAGGSAATSSGSVSGNYWSPSQSNTGGLGVDGTGGGGGGGGGGCDNSTAGYGAGGGGGGAGGVRAPSGGTGGYAGGSSFGIFVTGSTVTVQNVTINLGHGGGGGAGGRGGWGQPGGYGNYGGSHNGTTGGTGGWGGDGSTGGHSGAGGGGHGGDSYGIYASSSSVTTAGMTYSGGWGGAGGAGGSGNGYPYSNGQTGVNGEVTNFVSALSVVESAQPAADILASQPLHTIPTLVATSLVFRGNSAGYGGGLYTHPAACFTLTNGLFVDNQASSQGGGVYSDNSACLVLKSITAVGNSAGTAGGAIYNLGGNALELRNAILWANTAPSGAQLSVSTASKISYSDIQDGVSGGTNIITDDPLFMDLAGRLLGLTPASPARDVGSNTYVSGITVDLAGSPRIMGGTVDMGAYETWNTAPTLDNTGSPTLLAIIEDAPPTNGTLVSEILATGAGGDPISDPDPMDAVGIAILGADSSHGSWQYSLDDGSSWLPLGVLSEGAALLLEVNALTRLRFTPEADFCDIAEITMRAWDLTSGSAGDVTDTTINGGVTAFSVVTETASITVGNVNDAPVLDYTGSPTLATIPEDVAIDNGTLIVDLLVTGAGGNPISDVDPGAVEGIAILATDTTNGDWEYSLDGGSSWQYMVSPSATAARLLAADALTRLRFVPGTDFNGTAEITFAAWDQTSGSNGGVGNATVNGGVTAFSIHYETARITVTAVNDAPQFDPVGDQMAPEGALWSLELSASDVEGDAFAFTSITLPAWLTLTDHGDGTATLSGTPAFANVGDHVVTLKVTDSHGAFTTMTFTITVTTDLNQKLYLPLLQR